MSRAERIAGTERHIARQASIAKSAGSFRQTFSQPHRYAKRTWSCCSCWMCCNPRKRGELTMQERKANKAMASETERI